MEIQIKQLILENFRNFASKNLIFDKKLIMICGNNGIGKTNILEALTMVGRNHSLRQDDVEDMLRIDNQTQNKNQQFSIFCQIEKHDNIDSIAINYNNITRKKTIYINKENITNRNKENKNNLINFICLTPELELLFISQKSNRRDFLDKIVCDIDIFHSKRINDYQKLIKERLLLLSKNNKNNDKWLEIIENKISEVGVSIAIARVDAVEFFNKAIYSFSSKFPKSELKIIGEIELQVKNMKAIEMEIYYKEQLVQNRLRDKESFKTNFGVHRSDFSAIFIDKNMDAHLCSTGEQKSIMLGVTLARARISSQYRNQPTIIILDEIMSHLDDNKKTNLLNEIVESGLQCFFSTTSPSLIPRNFHDNKRIGIIDLLKI